MNYEIKIPSLNLDFTVPPSKSVVHRELIIKFLLSSFDKLRNPEGPQATDNDDIRATRACLKALYDAVGDDTSSDVIMPCNESGSTLRFMISVGAAFLTHMGLADKKRLVFLPKGRLIERPLDQLTKCLGDHGVTVSIAKEEGKIYVSGQLQGGVFKIEGNVSSQYASGLQMACLVIPGASVEIVGPLESKGYYELTLDLIKKYANTGVPEPVEGAEGDWSSAAFLLTLGVLVPDARVQLSGLNKDSFQKDKIILEILKKLGFEYEWNGSKLCLVKGRAGEEDFFVSELTLDAADYPDIVPYIAVAAAARCKHTIIKNIERLRFKECDRVEATIQALKAAGARACEKNGTLIIEGGFDVPENIFVSTFNDHRMAMTACLIAAWSKQPVMIDNKECVNKSFPGLWSII
jgi:3-phosphoshikimate 1-carboxyvinyltransferase